MLYLVYLLYLHCHVLYLHVTNALEGMCHILPPCVSQCQLVPVCANLLPICANMCLHFLLLIHPNPWIPGHQVQVQERDHQVRRVPRQQKELPGLQVTTLFFYTSANNFCCPIVLIKVCCLFL